MNQIEIILPDQSKRNLPENSTLLDLAQNISPGLARIALAGKINGTLSDLSTPLKNNDSATIITEKMPEGLEIIRHSTAHIMAMAIQEIFPGTQITIGPVVENQFYYDIYPKEGIKIGVQEFPLIEAKMKEIVEKEYPVEKIVISRDEAINHFKKLGETFKVEIVQDIPQSEDIKLYRINGWDDLCRGPHVPNTKKLGAFKLMSVAGAYWRANKDNAQLVRIYGTAWANKKDLDSYLTLLEEAKKRDHVLLGRQLELFTILGDVAPGAAFFMPKGTKVYSLLQNYIRRKCQKFNYKEVSTPQIMNVSLWKTSGHYESYKDDMYLFKNDDEEFGIKPMNCPGHVRLFMFGQKSYRDLPLRFSEFGVVHRNELSGTLHGLTRVRRFTQDDAHIFCMPDQIQSEIQGCLQFVQETYKDLGFDEVIYFLSTRPVKRVGSDDLWDKAEAGLKNALEQSGVSFTINEGDGAFYGPKIDFKIKDALGRLHQCATIQLDFQLPLRFQATYQSSQNTQDTPVMIHRAILGSIERFMGILIEHCAGHFPMGLAPVQCYIATLNESFKDYATELKNFLQDNGVRVEWDFSNDHLNNKIKHSQLFKIPYTLIIGGKEQENKTISARSRSGTNEANLTWDSFLTRVKNESEPFWGLDLNQK